MTLHVDSIEAFWVIVNLAALFLTLGSLIDARENRTAIRLLNGYARELAADGAIRREALRIVMQLLLLAVAVPSLFSDRVITLNPQLVALILVPVVLAATSFFDSRDRRRLTVITAAEIVVERDSSIKRLERLILDNTRISQGASDNAQAAFHEANDVNQKIATQGAQIVAQGERQDRRDAGAAQLQAVADVTATEVHDIHDATVPGQAS